MADNYYLKREKPVNQWLYIFILFLSFVLVSIYPVTNSLVYTFELGYGNMLDSSNPNFTYVLSSIFIDALYSIVIFEIVFYIYRFVLAFKIYSFVVPNDMLKVESRMFYFYKNIIYGFVLLLCFAFPYLYMYAEFFNLVITFTMLILYAKRLNKKYSEPVIGHFVFKNFCFPIFVYEAIVLIIRVMGVLA